MNKSNEINPADWGKSPAKGNNKNNQNKGNKGKKGNKGNKGKKSPKKENLLGFMQLPTLYVSVVETAIKTHLSAYNKYLHQDKVKRESGELKDVLEIISNFKTRLKQIANNKN